MKIGDKLRVRRLTRTRQHGADAETPWTSSSMGAENETSSSVREDGATVGDGSIPKVTAAFSPHQETGSHTLNRSSILIHQKSPLLVATPPQVTRALAYSHAFILPLNHFVGLLSWTSSDPWESFLMVTLFWFAVLYTDDVLRWTGPLMFAFTLILGMYARRYSPLSTTAWISSNRSRNSTQTKSRKSLDEILETLNEFTRRCDILVDPLLRMTEYLSIQATAISSTTRPALTTLFIRLLAFTPIWILLTLPPLRIITTKRTILTFGTIILTWHSRFAYACRAILWRSRSVRRGLSILTGLRFANKTELVTDTVLQSTPLSARAQATTAILGKSKSSGPIIRFTFAVYEHQRRWLGLGWTPSLLPGEGASWTDEHQRSSPEPAQYELPESENEAMRWRWVADSSWHIDGSGEEVDRDAGWTYYDNYWRDPRRTDGFSRYTRRRKWIRDAELVEIDSSNSPDAIANITPAPGEGVSSATSQDGTSITSSKHQSRPSWFLRRRHPSSSSAASVPDRSDALSSTESTGSKSRRSHATGRDDRDEGDQDVLYPLDRVRVREEWDRSVNDSVWQELS